MPDVLDNGRHDGDHDDRDDDQAEVVLHDGQVAEEVTGEHTDEHPRDPADDVVGEELRVRHRPDARHKRRKGPDNRHEARDDDGLAAVLLVERMRLPQVLRD